MIMPIENTMLISKNRYEELEEAEAELQALHNFGVDNWEGYSEAMEELNKNRKDK